MTITVSDYNDHTPMFTDAPYTGTISEVIDKDKALPVTKYILVGTNILGNWHILV